MENEHFYKILQYFNKRKSEHRGLKHIALLFHEVQLSYIH